MDNIVFLFKDPHTSFELDIIKTMNIGEILKTDGPKTCAQEFYLVFCSVFHWNKNEFHIHIENGISSLCGDLVIILYTKWFICHSACLLISQLPRLVSNLQLFTNLKEIPKLT